MKRKKMPMRKSKKLFSRTARTFHRQKQIVPNKRGGERR